MALSEQVRRGRKLTGDEDLALVLLETQAVALAKSVERDIKPTAERTLALRKLQEFRQWLQESVLTGGLHSSESYEAEHGGPRQ